MRGRTNVLSFSEDFINADVISAIADESISMGNFVKFYNAVDGGFSVNKYYEFMMQLSDGRLLCAGDVYAAGYSSTATILQRSPSGEYLQVLPIFPFTGGSGNRYNDTRTHYGRYLKIGENEFIYTRFGKNANGITLTINFLYFDVTNNQLSENVIQKNVNMTQFQNAAISHNSSYSEYYAAGTGDDTYGYNHQEMYLNGSALNMFASLTAAYSQYNPTSSSNGVRVRLLMHYIISISGSTGSRDFSFTQQKSLKEMSFAIATLSTIANYLTERDGLNVIFVQSKGWFIKYSAKNNAQGVYDADDYLLFVPLSGDIPDVIKLNSDTMFPDGKYSLLGFYGDYVYLLAFYSDKIYWAKIYFYDYTAANFQYLKWEPVLVFGDNNNRATDKYTSSTYDSSKGDNAFNFGFLLENNNIIRYFVTINYYVYANPVVYGKQASVLLDIDKVNNNIIVNPFTYSEGTFVTLGDNLNKILKRSDTLFTVLEKGEVKDYKIVNGSELSGNISNAVHVLNATDENYIMGVAKQSGTANETIECYKARVS